METMYPGKVNSPATTLDGGINNSVTTINVVDGSVLPAAPNIAVIGTEEDAETILYETKVGNELSNVTRGFQGVAKAWSTGEAISRLFTEYDYNALKENIETILDIIKPKIHSAVGSTDISVISQNYVDMADMSITATFPAGKVLIEAAIPVKIIGTLSIACLNVVVDTVQKTQVKSAIAEAGNHYLSSCLKWVETLTAGEHTIKIQWRVVSDYAVHQEGATYKRVLTVLECR